MKPYFKIRMLAVIFFAASQAVGATSGDTAACALGNEALAQKQPDLAVIQYNKCLSNSAPTFEVLSNLGIAYAQQKQFSQAIQAYIEALALSPDSGPIRMNLGLAYLKSDDPKRAAEQFSRSLMADPHNAKTLELLAYCHFQMGEYALAGYEAGVVHDASPNDPSAAFLLGSSYYRLEMYDRAIPLIYYSVSETKSPPGYMILGEAFLGVKAWHQALQAFQDAARLDPNLPGIYADEGQAYEGVGQPDKAKAALMQELVKNPNDFEANYLLGRMNRVNNDDADALKYLETANKLRPDDPSVAYEYAVLASQQHDYTKAESLLLGVVQRVPSYTDAHVLLAEIYFRLQKTDEGMREKSIVAALQQAQHARTIAEGKALSKEFPDSGGKAARRDP